MRSIALVAAVGTLAFLGATYFVTRDTSDDPFATCRASAVAGGGGDIGGPFTLVNASGETVTEQDVIDAPTLVYFGYTFCPDVCPFDVSRNADALDILGEAGYDAKGAFITVDPARDTPEVVGLYAEAMHPEMIGLTGAPEQIKAASQAYKTYYKAHPAEDEYYLVDHSTFTYLMLPEHGFADFFRRDVTAEAMASRVGCFIDNM